MTYASRRVQANGSVLSTPIRSDRHAVGLRRHRAAVHQQLARRQRGADSPRLQPGSDQRQRQRRHLPERRGVDQRSRRLVPRQLHGHRRVDDDRGDLEHAVDWRGGRAGRTCSCRRAPRTRRACSSPTRTRPRPASSRSTTTTRSTPPGSHLLKGGVRRAAHDQRRRLDLSRRLRAPQLGHVVRQQQRRRPAPAPTATTR